MAFNDGMLAVTVTGTAVATVGAAVAVVAKGARWMRQRLRKLDRFLEDWFGDPGAPDDDDRKLGMMAWRRKVDRRLTAIEGQLRPNGGTTVADAISRIDQSTGGPGVGGS